MTITLNSFDNNITSYSFKSKKTAQVEQPVQSAPQASDVVVDSTKKEKKSLWRGFRNFAAGVQKFFISTGEYLKGAVKGLLLGGASAASIIGASAVINRVKDIKAFKDVVNTRSLLKTPMKASTKGKVIAGAVGLAVLGTSLFKSYLNSNEKNSNVDHRWNTGHKVK